MGPPCWRRRSLSRPWGDSVWGWGPLVAAAFGRPQESQFSSRTAQDLSSAPSSWSHPQNSSGICPLPEACEKWNFSLPNTPSLPCLVFHLGSSCPPPTWSRRGIPSRQLVLAPHTCHQSGQMTEGDPSECPSSRRW